MVKQARTPDINATVVMPTPETRELMDYVGGKIPFGSLDLNFANGKKLTVKSMDLAPEIIGQALMHGLKQKLVDAAAITRDPSNGRSATVDTKYDAVKAVMDRLLEGEWNKRREGGPTGGLLKRALIEKYAGRKTPEQIQAFLDAKSDKEKAALRKNPAIATIIDRLRQEDAEESGEEVTDLLAELDDMPDADAGADEPDSEADE